MKTLSVSLGKTDPIVLKFQICKDPLAVRWSRLLKASLESSHIRDRGQFYNFPGSSSDVGGLLNAISNILKKIEVLRSDMDFSAFDLTLDCQKALQENLNIIHRDFADRFILDDSLSWPEKGLWDELNSTIHQVESAFYGELYKKKYGALNSRLYVPFENPVVEEISSEAFKISKLDNIFGDIHLSYPMVGRHFVEVESAEDSDCPKEHFKPFTKFSSDFNIYLGPTRNGEFHARRMKELETWYNKNKEFYSGIGYSWDPAELGIGNHVVAQLIEPEISPYEIQQSLLNKQWVLDVSLTD